MGEGTYWTQFAAAAAVFFSMLPDHPAAQTSFLTLSFYILYGFLLRRHTDMITCTDAIGFYKIIQSISCLGSAEYSNTLTLQYFISCLYLNDRCNTNTLNASSSNWWSCYYTLKPMARSSFSSSSQGFQKWKCHTQYIRALLIVIFKKICKKENQNKWSRR